MAPIPNYQQGAMPQGQGQTHGPLGEVHVNIQPETFQAKNGLVAPGLDVGNFDFNFQYPPPTHGCSVAGQPNSFEQYAIPEAAAEANKENGDTAFAVANEHVTADPNVDNTNFNYENSATDHGFSPHGQVNVPSQYATPGSNSSFGEQSYNIGNEQDAVDENSVLSQEEPVGYDWYLGSD